MSRLLSSLGHRLACGASGITIAVVLCCVFALFIRWAVIPVLAWTGFWWLNGAKFLLLWIIIAYMFCVVMKYLGTGVRYMVVHRHSLLARVASHLFRRKQPVNWASKGKSAFRMVLSSFLYVGGFFICLISGGSIVEAYPQVPPAMGVEQDTAVTILTLIFLFLSSINGSFAAAVWHALDKQRFGTPSKETKETLSFFASLVLPLQGVVLSLVYMGPSPFMAIGGYIAGNALMAGIFALRFPCEQNLFDLIFRRRQKEA